MKPKRVRDKRLQTGQADMHQGGKADHPKGEITIIYIFSKDLVACFGKTNLILLPLILFPSIH